MEQFEIFFAKPKVQAVTISLAVFFLFFIFPLLRRKVGKKLAIKQKKTYDRISKEILFQTCLLFVGVVVYSLVAMIRSDSSFVSGDALPFVSFLGALAAFWNLRKAVIAIREANSQTNEHRKARLEDIYKSSLGAYTLALIAAVYGLFVILLVLFDPNAVPLWLWFVSFGMTGVTIRALGWSIASLEAAIEYANNLKLGRANPSPKNKSARTSNVQA
ncbi:hypothetical protein [Massilia agri]|uniref:Uncharacterized protein n=1 Tax=Massilia agri TaxID=1886785 RepID=A0ABT2ANY3_9BURK|nr:hypothetical protein [Massilia agri]MCS0597675.1 hypothetical protein [Massilia agri]